LGVDPLEGNINNPISRHRYLYGNSNPISYSDPSGKFSIGEFTAGLVMTNILSLAAHASVSYLISRRSNEQINWSGYATTIGSPSTALFGIPSYLAGTVVLTTLTSSCYNGQETFGGWALLGLGAGVTAVTNTLGSIAMNSLAVLSPAALGIDGDVLSGAFNAISFNLVSPLGAYGVLVPAGDWSFSASYTNLFMGFGYSIIGSGLPGPNSSMGLDFSAGITSGLSIKLKSETTPC
jgi:hypothetical protein